VGSASDATGCNGGNPSLLFVWAEIADLMKLTHSSEQAVGVAALAGNLYFFFPSIATGLTAVFLIVRNWTAAGFVRTLFRLVFRHDLRLLPVLASLAPSILPSLCNFNNWEK
jgi:hypothetical protein